MVMRFSHVDHGGYFRSIVTRDNDESVIRNFQFLQLGKQGTHHMIKLKDEVAVRTASVLPLKSFPGKEGK